MPVVLQAASMFELLRQRYVAVLVVPSAPSVMVLLVVIVAMLLCVTSQQIVAQRLRVRQQAIPLVAQVHG